MAALLLLLLTWLSAGSKNPQKTYSYCIVGAGPAGIQLGHFLFHAGRDYIIFERNSNAGSFFEKFPRHRKLISLNKRFVREGRAADFAFRHDWNSLIDLRENRTQPVTQRSSELFPHADVLVGYLREFAEEQRDFIRYNSEVVKVSRQELSPGQVFTIKLEGGDMTQCGEVILAHGLTVPRQGQQMIDGLDLVDRYEDMPATGESFEGKSVMILGMGNAALEAAQELQKYTAEVHVLARPRPLPEGGEGVRFAYQTHYVGDIRAGRTSILDTYLLKSLDVFDFDALQDHRVIVLPCKGNRRCVWVATDDVCADERCRKHFYSDEQNMSLMLYMGRIASQHEPRVRETLERLAPDEEGHGWVLDVAEDVEPKVESYFATSAVPETIDPSVFEGSFTWVLVNSRLLREKPELMDAMADFRMKYAAKHTRFPVDHVIRCFGWTMDTSFLDLSTKPEMLEHGKYPNISTTFQVSGIPGLYAAGTISHSLDFRKSAGGFIHGFRYTTRTLFHLLEEKNFGAAWPQISFVLDRVEELTSPVHESVPWLCEKTPSEPGSGVAHLAQELLDRINEASGPYQMFEFLGDMVLFEKNSSTEAWNARYLLEVPLEDFHHRYAATARLTWVFRYNEHFHGPVVLSSARVGAVEAHRAHKSNFLHPYIAYFPANASKPAREHWLPEDVHTQWHADEVTLPLRNFVALIVNELIDGPAQDEDDPDSAPDF
ncbi:unnamed protein product [Durusdinium trenchii]|uniref:Uncharacterized protein n=1 Tax=Durusdinium trenchii TaxID=1381693 RepID=A0ABP0QEM1_9DINO